MNEEYMPSRSHRLEDLGRIREMISNILKHDNIFDECTSKHTYDSFIQKYSVEGNLEDLHDAIRKIGENLDEIHHIAMGGNYDDY